MDTPTPTIPSPPAVATPDAYVAALDEASAALGKAITSCLEGDSIWRFSEVQRLCKIGQAIMRMRTRANPAVAGYVDPNAPRMAHGLANCNIGGVDPLYDELGLDEQPHMNPWPPNLGPVPIFNRAGAVPGNAVVLPQPRVAPGVDGIMEMLRESLASIESNSNKQSQVDLVLELRKLGELLETKLEPAEREVLQARRKEIIATVAARTELDRRARETNADAAPAQVRHARCDGCGTAHDADWVTRDGRLRACDVCGGPMRWSDEDASQRALPPALDSETTPNPQPEPQENAPCPASSSRTSGTSRRRTATSASKRSARAKRS